jgi:hypothetical protein
MVDENADVTPIDAVDGAHGEMPLGYASGLRGWGWIYGCGTPGGQGRTDAQREFGLRNGEPRGFIGSAYDR